MKLRISDDCKLPIDAVTQRISILGKTRSGKSHTAGVLVEEVLKASQQVVILDPKGDWWGLRSSADGKSAGLPITIMGGKRGDVPLEPTAGTLAADIVINEGISVVFDLSFFESRADEIRFVTAFLDRLYRKNTEPVLLVIDEADVFAPQKPEKNETIMLNRMETICRRGAGRGIGVVLVSQRSASIHKGCLSQTELMVAHQTTAPQDKEAIKLWVVHHGDEERRNAFMSRITDLPTGTAIFWSPSWLEIYKEVGVRRKETYDSSATPRVGQRRRPPKVLAQVDLERLKKHMAETIEKAKQEDPKELRAEVARLKVELARAKNAPRQASAPAPAPVSENDVKVVEVPILGKRALRRLEKLVERVETSKSHLGWTAQSLEIATRDIQATIERLRDGKSINEVRKAVGLPYVTKKVQAKILSPRPASPTEKYVEGNGQKLDKCARSILAVLSQHPNGCSIGKIALLAGYKKSGTFMSTLSTLRTNEFMTGSNSGTMMISERGSRALGNYEPLPTGDDLANYWLSHPSLDKCGRQILKALLESPEGLLIAEICEKTGYSASGTFMSTLSSLRTAGVMVGKNSERMKASEDLFG